MVYLQAWHHVLERQAPNGGRITILDHGPIYRLALLREFGPELIKGPSLGEWWDRTLDQWAASLDMVIWLDAPDATLLRRIHDRDRWHVIQEKPDRDASDLLARYRASFENVIARLTAPGDPKVLCFDTDEESLSQIVDRVLATFGLEHDNG